MALISKRGVLGVKWSWIVIGALAYFFRKPLIAFAKPLYEKILAKVSPNPSPVDLTAITGDITQ